MSKTVSKRSGHAAGGTALRLRPLCAAIVAVMPALAGADIVPDQTAAQRATMGQTANGTPMVNIVDPNQRGISHNKFQSFNVGNGGVVFNNSMNNGVSAIGGLAMKNANLSNEARAIIGEVTGSGRSALNGAMEIFGRKADLIIANPNGIQVNGASTVNANSLTLSTGKVLGQPDGSVRLGVEGGTVRIDGAGISTEGLTYFDVISRTAELNGEIKGQADIKVVAGKTEYDPATRTHVATPGAAAEQAIAIDGSQLGSMYGGRIELVATDSGAGVRHQGSLVGNNGIRVTADGDIVIGAAQSQQGRIDIAGRNVTVTGTPSTGAVGLTSYGDIAIRALQTVGLHADLLTQNGTVAIDASTLVQHAAKILAARGEAGTVAVPGIRISVGDYRIEGTLYATNAAGERIDGATVLLEGGNYVVRDSEGRIVDGARVASTAQVETTSGAVSIGAGNLSVDGGVVVANGGALEINVAEMLRNEGLLSASDAVALTAGTMENKGVATGADLTVRADSLANTGKLSANGQLEIDVSQSIDNAGTILAGGALNVEGVRELVNRDGGWMQGNTVGLREIERLTNRDKGVLVAVNQMSLDGIGSIANDDAILQGGNVRVTNAGTVTNESGAVIQAAQSLTIDGADSLSNDKSKLVAGGTLEIHDVTTIDNKDDALIQAGQALTIDSAGSLSNDNAMLAAGGALNVRDVRRIDNNAGRIAADGNVAIERAQELANRNAAQISAARDIAIAQVGAVSNTGANVYADGSVTISGATAVANSDGGVIGAGGALDIGAQTLDNRGKDSLLQGATGATFIADSIDNADGAAMISGDTLRIEADTVTNASKGVIHGETGASIIAAGALVNTGAETQMGSGGALQITADTVSNDSGAMIYGASEATIDAGSVRNKDGSTIVATDGKLTIHAEYLIENAASGIVGAELELATQSLNNLRNGQIESDGNATIDVNTINNREGQIWAGRTLDVKVREDLVFGRNAGALNAGELLKASTTRNVQVMSALENAGAIDLHADGDLVNRSAIISGRAVTLSAGNIENTANSLIWAMQDVSLDAARARSATRATATS